MLSGHDQSSFTVIQYRTLPTWLHKNKKVVDAVIINIIISMIYNNIDQGLNFSCFIVDQYKFSV